MARHAVFALVSSLACAVAEQTPDDNALTSQMAGCRIKKARELPPPHMVNCYRCRGQTSADAVAFTISSLHREVLLPLASAA
jgi:hypothetical protein